MKNSAHFSGFILTLLFIFLSSFIANNALARPDIYALAKSKGIKVTSCQSCHNSARGNEAEANLKPNIYDAREYDKVNLSRLKNLINGCPSGQLLTPTFLCVKPVTVSGTVGSSGSGAPATDVYAVTCGTGSSYLWISVKDLAPAKLPLVSIQAIKGFASSPLSTDGKDGDAIFSPKVKLTRGAGIYNLQINKQLSSIKGVELYSAQFVCLNVSGAKMSTSAAVRKQNQ